MSYARQLTEMLRAMGVYRLEESYLAGELSGVGEALDAVGDSLDILEREGMLDTARDQGLEKLEGLLAHRPVTSTVEGRRKALAALLRIGGDSFTLDDINDNLRGCGINAVVSETGTASTVEVRFPDVPGMPDGYGELKKIIEDILPCHLQIDYIFWYITWAMMEEKFATWGEIEAGGYSWEELEKMVR